MFLPLDMVIGGDGRRVYPTFHRGDSRAGVEYHLEIRFDGLPSECNGDIDVLLWPPHGPQHATAFQVKRMKVGRDPVATGRPNIPRASPKSLSANYARFYATANTPGAHAPSGGHPHRPPSQSHNRARLSPGASSAISPESAAGAIPVSRFGQRRAHERRSLPNPHQHD